MLWNWDLGLSKLKLKCFPEPKTVLV